MNPSTLSEETAGHRIDSHTVLYGVIGDPIRHSKSPIMMNRAFRETGVNGVYAAYHITSDKLADFIGGVRAMGIRGVNVTIPHKLDIMKHMDAIDPGAEAIGAVNTIVNDNGRLTGYNTDGIGYVRSLKEEAEPAIAGKRIVVIGAGGASRGIVYALAGEKPASITIANRTEDRARELAQSFSSLAELRAVTYDGLQEACRDADIVINTTSVGMHPHTDASPVEAGWLKQDAVASDLIYNPLKTKFLQQAEQAGCRIHGGLGMFIYQGAYAFEYWTGQTAPVAAMRETVLASLI
ncbi:shikimate dehydrogenase [Paenibacillus radicis (ex Gao et al. 2016)]|uniref:Shikimate dehydrogenase (NADP(+)) n=1 Tax=Paenibacillus radicis (ex Gao et al. 2016) TaxID=1737354 RepID=A0A917HPU1_9BACL|nr:shikimate dehydrogenase [Paenibacillus radicis (ex Gao et al. 2016)]GGG86538.1 shikimate dehydrogenase (NADP(+)) [Paenibacillus radicis (ex Gao et al. 2016)]